MSYEPLNQGSVVLRLEFSIEDAVHQRGLFAVLTAALAAWWNRPRLPQDLPANLREDIGLPPLGPSSHFIDIRASTIIPGPLKRPGM